MEPFKYPDDRDSLFHIPEEEAHFYYCLGVVEDYTTRHGAHFVLSRMRNESFAKISEWFSEIESTTSKPACSLLKKQNAS